MRLYLSSFGTGQHQHRLLQMTCGGRRTALVPNALDGLPDEVRAAGLRRDFGELQAAGLDVTLLDVHAPGAAGNLAAYDLVWVRGGNVFVLRRALADSGADMALLHLLQADALVYGGYSAGACVLAPDLSALRDVDDMTCVAAPIITGLGLLDRPFIPHVNSPGHPETAECDGISAALDARGQAHWALRDGDVLVVDGKLTQLLSADS